MPLSYLKRAVVGATLASMAACASDMPGESKSQPEQQPQQTAITFGQLLPGEQETIERFRHYYRCIGEKTREHAVAIGRQLVERLGPPPSRESFNRKIAETGLQLFADFCIAAIGADPDISNQELSALGKKYGEENILSMLGEKPQRPVVRQIPHDDSRGKSLGEPKEKPGLSV